jgi:hypothetical protein
MLTKFQQVATDIQIWRSFRSRRRLTIASDGGLKNGVGTFGWLIASKDNSGTRVVLFAGSGPVDGPKDIANSTRSELGGLSCPTVYYAPRWLHTGGFVIDVDIAGLLIVKQPSAKSNLLLDRLIASPKRQKKLTT